MKNLKKVLREILVFCLIILGNLHLTFAVEQISSQQILDVGGLYTSGANIGKDVAGANRVRSKFYSLNDAQLTIEVGDNSLQYAAFFYDGHMSCIGWSNWKNTSSSIEKIYDSEYVRIVLRYKDNHNISENEVHELEKCIQYLPISSNKHVFSKKIVQGSCFLSGNQIGKELEASNRARTSYYDTSRVDIHITLPTSDIQYGYLYFDEFLNCKSWSGWKGSSNVLANNENAFIRVIFRYSDNREIGVNEISDISKCFDIIPALLETQTTLKVGALFTSGNYIGKELGSTTRARSEYYELGERRIKIELSEPDQQYTVFFYDENKNCIGTSGWTSGTYRDEEEAVYVRVVFRYIDNRAIEESELPILEKGIKFEEKTPKPEENIHVCGPKLTWSFEQTTGLLSICGSGVMTNFSSVEDTPWFKFKDDIISIEFNGENIEIGNHAFEGLNISSLDLTNVISIGDCAFKNCSGIQGLVDGSNLTWIGEGSFENCSNISSIYIGTNVTYIGDCALKNCSNLSSIIFVEDTKFRGNVSLEGVKDNITIIVGKDMYIPIGDNDVPATGSTTVINISKNENNETIIKENGKPDILPPMGSIAESATITGNNSIIEGESVTLKGDIYPLNAVNRGFTWTTSDESVVVIDCVSEDTKTVTVIGIKAGEGIIRAVNKNNGVSAEFVVTVLCAHKWSNGICEKCGETCKHEWEDGTCKVCSCVCEHIWENGKCKNCKLECKHEFFDNKCLVCGYECVEHKWNSNLGKCSVCGKECIHEWSDGVCMICGKVCTHDIYVDSSCIVCGYECVEHKWSDGSCNVCGKKCEHQWNDGNCGICGMECNHEFEAGKCIICGYECIWHSWSEGICSVCGEKCKHDGASYQQNAFFIYDWDYYEFQIKIMHSTYCDTCNLAIADECYDINNDGLCDVCGECVHLNLRKEPIEEGMHNVICEDCGKVIIDHNPCEDTNNDGICDICGNVIYKNPGTDECTCGCGLIGGTCGTECPMCNIQ